MGYTRLSEDEIRNLPRVPHADDDGKQEGVASMRELKYGTTSEVVDARVAQSRMQGRKHGDLAPLASAARVEDPAPARAGGGDPEVGLGGPAGSGQDRAAPPPLTPEDIARDLSSNIQVVYRDRVVEKPVEKLVEVEKPAPWAEWLKKRVRVEISTTDMTFHVSAVDVISSGHGITVLLPTADGAMTFTPKIGSEVTVGTKDTGYVRTRYTGVSFDLEQVGVFGLCFLIIPASNSGNGVAEDLT